MGVEINELDISYNTPYGEGGSGICSSAFIRGRKNLISTAESLGPGKNIQSSAFSAFLNHMPCRVKVLDFSILDVTYSYPTGAGTHGVPSSAYVLNDKSLPSQAHVEPVHKDLASWAYRPNYNHIVSSAKINEHLEMDFGLSIMQPPIYSVSVPCVKDTFTRQSKPKLNYGGFQTMVVGVAADGQYISYVEFDISNLYNYMAYMNVVDVALNLYQIDTSRVNISLYECFTDFQENYTTWYSSLSIASTPFFTGSFSTRNMQVGIKDYVASMIDAGRTKFRFAIKSSDYVVLNTRESGSPPVITMLYTDPNWDEGRLGSSQLACSAHVKVDKFDNLFSHVKVNYRDNKPSYASVRNGKPSKAHVIRTGLLCKCTPRLANSLNSQAIVRREGYSDLTSKGDHNESFKPSRTVVPHRKDLLSQVTVIPTSDITEVNGKAFINRPELPSTVGVYKYTEVASSAVVRQQAHSDLAAYLTATNDRKISYANVYYSGSLPSQVVVWQEEGSTVASSAYVAGRKDIYGKVVPRYKYDIPSQSIVRHPHTSDITSQAYVSKSTLICWCALRKHSNLECRVSVLQVRDVVSEATVRITAHGDVPSQSMTRRGSSVDLYSTAFILGRKDLNSSSTIQRNKTTDIESEVIVRKSGYLDISSQADIYNRFDLISHSVVMQTKDLCSTVIVRQFDLSDLSCRTSINGGWYKNVIESQVCVRKTILDIPCKVQVVSGARIWRPNHEGELNFEDRKLPRIWRRAQFIND